MKKTLLSLVAFVMIITSAYAQTSFGIKAGANWATFGGDIDGTSTKIGFHVGGVATLMIFDNFAFAPELLFSTQGTTFEAFDYGGVRIPEAQWNLSYVNIPMLTKVFITDRFTVHSGPTVGFLLDAKDEDEDVKKYLKDIDFGIAIGAGYQLESGLNFVARYHLGAKNIVESEPGGDYRVTNQVVQVSVGFNF